MLAIIYLWAIIEGGTLANVINYLVLVVVFMPAFLFSISGSKDIKTRVKNFSFDAVLAGWIGTLIGIIMILIKFEFANWQEFLPPAIAIGLLTILYGYVVRAMCFLLLRIYQREKASKASLANNDAISV
tara:strand:+ start:410 stop:796 length:387 start_codon:yes stop_codon:yes gene_type:complete